LPAGSEALVAGSEAAGSEVVAEIALMLTS
jgi:hypothetical protein